jgi:UDP-N-acetyl-D-glucosamine dehydrogenase
MVQIPLARKVDDRTATVAVIGLGYVGLPLALEIAKAGFRVLGIEIDRGRVKSIEEGVSYIDDVPSEDLQRLVEEERLSATNDYEALRAADIIMICVPTPLTKSKDPDLSYLNFAARGIIPSLQPGQLVILESTTYPGTTQEIIRPLLETSGLRAGRDFHLAFSPERIDPGNRRFTIRDIPKIVGGLTSECTGLAKQFYGTFFRRVVVVSSPTVAEMVKVYENVFRNVNIALVNELTPLCDRMGLDVWEIIDAAATKPYGFMPFFPGPGVGGHCIPVDPYYLAAKAREHDFHVQFIELAAVVNDGMPYHVIQKVRSALDKKGRTLRGARTLVLGLAYKRDISDMRESPSVKIIELLHKQGAVVSYHDPHVPEFTMPNPGEVLHSVPLTDETLASADCVIVATDHSSVDYHRIADKARLVIDTRNVMPRDADGNVVRL